MSVLAATPLDSPAPPSSTSFQNTRAAPAAVASPQHGNEAPQRHARAKAPRLRALPRILGSKDGSTHKTGSAGKTNFPAAESDKARRPRLCPPPPRHSPLSAWKSFLIAAHL